MVRPLDQQTGTIGEDPMLSSKGKDMCSVRRHGGLSEGLVRWLRKQGGEAGIRFCDVSLGGAQLEVRSGSAPQNSFSGSWSWGWLALGLAGEQILTVGDLRLCSSHSWCAFEWLIFWVSYYLWGLTEPGRGRPSRVSKSPVSSHRKHTLIISLRWCMRRKTRKSNGQT